MKKDHIDRKFLIIAVNPAKRPIVGAIVRALQWLLLFFAGIGKGGVYTDREAALFLAKDEIFLSAIYHYVRRCRIVLGRDSLQTISARLLLERVQTYQRCHETKNPDVDPGREEQNVIMPGEDVKQGPDQTGGFDGTARER